MKSTRGEFQMTRRDDENKEDWMNGTTRRDSLRLGVGAGLAALAASALNGRLLLAQEATPDTGTPLDGHYVVVRSRTIKPDRSPEELIALIREGFLPLVRTVPGFVSYQVVVHPESRTQFSVGVFTDQASAEESTRLAAEWGAEGAADYVEGDPIVVEGPIVIAAEASA
jgi:hypothetical protein